MARNAHQTVFYCLLLLAAGPLLAGDSLRDQPGGPAVPGVDHAPPAEVAGEAVYEPGRQGIIRVLALLRIESGQGGFQLLELAGQAGILVDEMGGAGEMTGAPVYRLWGRSKSPGSVFRLRSAVDKDRFVQVLWLAWAEVPDGATRPVPLTTVVWSPLLYPNRAAALTRGPAGPRRYYLDPGTASVLESTNDGKDFTTVFTAGRAPEFVEGGRGIDMTKIFWRQKVKGWIAKQDKTRDKGWEKYGPLLDASSGGDDPQPVRY